MGELDHYIERGRGGPSTRENGWRLCSRCHQAKIDNASHHEGCAQPVAGARGPVPDAKVG